ncbi:protein NEDD1 [Rhinatrema bivittatum]|uniref:protein NEDD1 n=1 Tax=Rhinatrema bivittatum TaxID=194408 RepID=UPI001126DDE9|nr:protein NEDD1 [Rhinatrema bivittatum]XP_029457412.1 protein NEDD1 [Rhinatrema bivittatum]XP_029457414.1 protein NEDD1 [Rhinatrema bivittatum]XP_029457415.1 protein NEDD1 [Rhinatrema bivittatum]
MQENTRFASSGDDIKIWDPSSMTVVEQFNPHNSSHAVTSLCWSRNNHFLVSASGSGDKIVVSSCKSKPVPLLELAEGKKQTYVNLNSSSQYLVSGGLDNTVNIWDLKSKRLHRSIKDHKDEVTCVTFNGNDCYVASGSMSGEIILHNVTTNLSSTPFGHGSSQPIRQVRYSFLKKSLLGSVSDGGTVTLWDANSQNAFHTFDSAHKAPASGICFSPVNDLLFVTVGLDKRIICYDASSKILLRTLVAESSLTAVDFMPDGASLAIGSSRGKIYQYDLRMLTSPVKTVGGHKTSVQCIQFQHSTTFAKSSGAKNSSKSASLLSAAMNKRATVKAGSVDGGNQTANTARSITSVASVTVLPPPVATSEGKAIDSNQDKIGKDNQNLLGVPRSTSLDVIPSKETDYTKSSDVKNLDTFGRSSLGDMFSPVRDDTGAYKASDDLVAKEDALDFLQQFGALSSARRNPIGASATGTQSSPLCFFGASPIKEEDENQDTNAKTQKTYPGKQEPREPIKQLAKLSSSSADSSGNVNTPSSIMKTPEADEKRGRELQTQLTCDSLVNGISLASPKMTTSLTAAVASSLSEKISETIGSDKASAPLTPIQIHFIKNMIQETLDDFREACHRDIVNLQVEMIKQFHMQLNEMHVLLERYSVNEGLVAEIERLREENKRLRTHF